MAERALISSASDGRQTEWVLPETNQAVTYQMPPNLLLSRRPGDQQIGSSYDKKHIAAEMTDGEDEEDEEDAEKAARLERPKHA
ncbi:unnamed protein product [Protopolystoma xenopodis]|uniref:Uncharacterized protein n=1 Tax=Protopolystoma xenopodis TaxID=117903 RepID=A0A3S5AYT1_9PLAT|nr:unnamed protein product [Protopolystoma xenopodis]